MGHAAVPVTLRCEVDKSHVPGDSPAPSHNKTLTAKILPGRTLRQDALLLLNHVRNVRYITYFIINKRI